jgi:hypothetical protein
VSPEGRRAGHGRQEKKERRLGAFRFEPADSPLATAGTQFTCGYRPRRLQPHSLLLELRSAAARLRPDRRSTRRRLSVTYCQPARSGAIAVDQLVGRPIRTKFSEGPSTVCSSLGYSGLRWAGGGEGSVYPASPLPGLQPYSSSGARPADRLSRPPVGRGETSRPAVPLALLREDSAAW